MNGKPIWVWIVAGAVLFLAFSSGASGPKPAGPDLLPAFKQTNDLTRAKTDAQTLAALCTSVADCIEYDGARGEQARLTNGTQMDNLRRWSREYLLKGESLGQRYPQLPDAIKNYLDGEVGTSGGPIDAETRKRWIKAHRTLAASAEWAAGQL